MEPAGVNSPVDAGAYDPPSPAPVVSEPESEPHPIFRSEECAEDFVEATASTWACVGSIVGGALGTAASGPLAPAVFGASAVMVMGACGIAGYQLAEGKDSCSEAPSTNKGTPVSEAEEDDGLGYVDGYC